MNSLGSRMKNNYEDRYRIGLTRRTPVIIRLDGKAFHTLTRGFNKPFDPGFQSAMAGTTEYLCGEIQGVKLAYMQSDEISLLLTDFDRLSTDAWFDYNLQKMVSVSASMASVVFSRRIGQIKGPEYFGFFDSRAFNLPKEEVANYFLWRQKDWIRNSVMMLAQANFSHKELHGKNQADMHEMLYSKGINWNDLNPECKNGLFFIKSETGKFNPENNFIISQKRDLIEFFLTPFTEEGSK